MLSKLAKVAIDALTERSVSRPRCCGSVLEWQTVVGSEANVGVLNLGATFSLTNHLTLLTNLGVGITQDAPDMVATVRVPYQF